ncbi:MAG: DUF6166 domain-containing protein [Bacteroidota bacterium]
MTQSALALRPSRVSSNHTTPAGTRIPSADLHARRIAREAGLWRAFAGDRTRMLPPTLDAKALDACAFSVLHGASSFAVPSKLVGTSRHQSLLRSLSEPPTATWLALDLDARGDHLVASHRGRVLGRVQPKHLGWVRPLVPFGLALYLSRVTGRGEGCAENGAFYRLGCNVVFGHVGAALARLADASGGDGAPPASGAGHLRLVVPEERPAPDPLSVRILPEREALSGAPDDIVLWRTLEGEAHASVPHAVRHSPTGIEWGYLGSGPADLALSVLMALTDEQTARALYQRFKAEVIARVPEVGGVLPAADVRAWATRAQGAHALDETEPGWAA